MRPDRFGRLGLALVLVAGIAAGTAPTTGLTTLAADRDAGVATTFDHDAYLGIEPPPIELENGRHGGVVLLWLTNGLPAPLTAVEVVVVDPTPRPPRLHGFDSSPSLSVGATGAVTATVICGGPAGTTENWIVEIDATGPDTSVTLTRAIAVECIGGPEPPNPPDGKPDQPRGPPDDVPPNDRGRGPP